MQCKCVYVFEIYRKLGYGGAATTYLGIENGVIPNVVVQIATCFVMVALTESPPSTCKVLTKIRKYEDWAIQPPYPFFNFKSRMHKQVLREVLHH